MHARNPVGYVHGVGHRERALLRQDRIIGVKDLIVYQLYAAGRRVFQGTEMLNTSCSYSENGGNAYVYQPRRRAAVLKLAVDAEVLMTR